VTLARTQPAANTTADAVAEIAIDPRLASDLFRARISRDFARSHVLLSQGCADGVERIVAGEKTSPAALHNVSVRLGRPIDVLRADAERVVRAVDVLYGELAPARPQVAASEVLASTSLDDLLNDAERDLLRTQGKGLVQRLVDALLFEAVGKNASDVHLQPTDGDTLVRVRLDGALATVRRIPKGLTPAVLGRIKVMGRMDVAERRLPQDGRATVRIGERAIDLRIGISKGSGCLCPC
jgi:general secretion pathway protein E